MIFKLITLSLIINLIIILFFKKLVKLYNIYDVGDGIRKFQKKPISLIGGFCIFLNLLIFILLDFYFENEILEGFFLDQKELFSFCFGALAFFLFGLIDDKFILKPNIKLFILIIISYFLVKIDNSLLLKTLYFSSLDYQINLGSFSIFFTILCILLFTNSLNMFDGINLQVGSYSTLIFLIFTFKGILPSLNILLCLSLLFFIYLNYDNKTFLGGSGVHLIAFLISYFFIKSYNVNQDLFSLEEIFIIMGLPGLELLRLFILRSLNGKHPFKADTNHLHHLLNKKMSTMKTFLIIFSYILFTIILFYLIESSLFYIISYCAIYILIIFYLTRKESI